MVNYFFSRMFYAGFLSFCFLVGNIPIWVLVLAGLLGKLTPESCILLIGVVLLAGAFNRGYIRYSTPLFGSFNLTWYTVKPVFQIITLYCFYTGVYFVLMRGDITGYKIIALIIFLYLLKLAVNILLVSKESSTKSDVFQSSLFKFIVPVLWLYFLTAVDGIFMMYVTLTVIYIYMYISSFKPDFSCSEALKRYDFDSVGNI